MSASIETPSKGAAAALLTIDLNSPKKLFKATDKKTEVSALNTKKADETDSTDASKHASDLDDTRRFVGDLSITSDEQEPLLQESGQRFVLFPIKYHEVCCSVVFASRFTSREKK
jgi:ribonucleoside-diphosphate reductase subunit M2